MASYPGSAKIFTTKSDGPGNTILAAHVNDLQSEVTAIEQDLIAGLPVARGGTGATSVTANRLPYGNAGGTAYTSSASLTFDGTTLTAPATTITQPLTISGASAGQIVFPATQNAASNANTLDDYEEGVWTPTITGSGGASGQVYSVQVGKYTKVGKFVMCSFKITLSTLGTVTANAQIGGLPFTVENTTNGDAAMCVGYWANFTTALVQVSGVAAPNTTAITLYGSSAASASLANLAQVDFSNTTSLVGVISFMASA